MRRIYCMKKKWMIIGGVALVVFIMGSSCVGKYNQLVTMDESITGAWAQVENVLQRRNDLIPNLVNTVKGYAAHEQEIFENVAEARSQWAAAKTINEKVQANAALESALGRLLALIKRYPNLNTI